MKLKLFLFCFVLSFTVLFATVQEFQVTLDDNTQIRVFNGTPWSNSIVASLVLIADRSTRSDRVHSPGKGLFKTNDIIFVNENYLAWFDYTIGDGADLDFYNYWTKYHGGYGRSGSLAGYWTLDAASKTFMYIKFGPGPDFNSWAHNELIIGSASPDGEKYWWDHFAPPVDLTLVVEGTEIKVDSNNKEYYDEYTRSYVNSQVEGENWDGLQNVNIVGNNLTLKTHCDKLSGFSIPIVPFAPQTKDISDGNDDNGISNWIEAEVEYICKANEIDCRWSFRANDTVTISSIFMYLWTNYAQDEDGKWADRFIGDPGYIKDNWPTNTYGKPQWTKSSLDMIRVHPDGNLAVNAGNSGFLPIIPAAIQYGIYVNPECRTIPAENIVNGSWIQFGQNQQLNTLVPRIKYTNLGVPNSGTGTKINPIQFKWNTLLSWNESYDGSYGIGAGNGPYGVNASGKPVLQGGQWYQAGFSVTSLGS